MFKKILIGFIVVLALFAVVVSLRPSEFHVERSASISAPPAVVFEQVNDLHKWQAWSPWAKMDPAAKVSYEGPTAGTGAVFHWDGNKDVGAGSMTIVDSRPNVQRLPPAIPDCRRSKNLLLKSSGVPSIQTALAGSGVCSIINEPFDHHSQS